MSMTLTAYNK